MFFRFATKQARDGQTDGQTDRRTDRQTVKITVIKTALAQMLCAVKIDHTTTYHL